MRQKTRQGQPLAKHKADKSMERKEIRDFFSRLLVSVFLTLAAVTIGLTLLFRMVVH